MNHLKIVSPEATAAPREPSSHAHEARLVAEAREAQDVASESLLWLAKHLDQVVGDALEGEQANAHAQLVRAIGNSLLVREALAALDFCLKDAVRVWAGLDTCLAFHGVTRWSWLTVAVAKADYFEGDCEPAEWPARLDLLESVLVKLPGGDAAEVAP